MKTVTAALGSPRGLYSDVTRAALMGLAVNLALGAAKLAAGLVTGSFALLSDAVNSLGDAFASVVVLVAFHVAQRPPDDEHPYGHTRAEAIAGSNVALLIAISALLVGWETLRQFGGERPSPPLWTLWLAGANVLIKEALYRYKIRIGRRAGSSAIVANAWDHRSDALCALAVFIGLAVVHWGGARYSWVDGAAALVVVAAILWSAGVLFLKSASELMDVQASGEFVDAIRQTAEAEPEVRAVEKLWVRKSGLEFFVDIHIEVDPELTVAEGHEIGHRVKDRLLAKFVAVRDVLVHLEPWPHDPPEAASSSGGG